MYKVYCCTAVDPDFRSFWYKTKGGRAGTKKGAAFLPRGETIIKEEGCLIRYAIKTFAGLPKKLVERMNREFIKNEAAFIGNHSDGLPQVYGDKLNRYIFQLLRNKLQYSDHGEDCNYGGISFLELGMYLLMQGLIYKGRYISLLF